MIKTPPFIEAKNLVTITTIRHGFFSRHGGVSSDIYASLNVGLGSDDDPSNVLKNRTLCEIALGGPSDSLTTVHQIHSAKAIIIDEHSKAIWSKASSPTPKADGIVTKSPNVILGVLTADCMPFLFVDEDAAIIGAAHAGWRGALNGVLEATIDTMVSLGASPANIKAALGPCLRQDNFEVGLDLVEEFISPYPQATQFFKDGKTPNKRQFDLASFAFWRLQTKGITHIDDVDICTLANPKDYFSYRYSRQAKQEDYGRNLSAIMLRSII